MTPIVGAPPVAPSPSVPSGVDRESLVLDGLDLNDGATRTLVGLEFTPAKKLLEWVKGADSDGSKLLRMAKHENAEFDLRIFIRNSTRDTVLDTVGGIIDKLQEAERQSAGGLGRGLELIWTPMGSTYSYTFYVLAGETNLARAEDFYKLGKPFLDLKLYTSPFGYGPEVSTSTTTSSLPLVTMTVADVPGDVPAECRITVTDGASQSRDYVAVGLQNLSYDSGTALFHDSADFVTSGFAGSQTTRTGAYSSNGVVRATLTTTPVAVCSSAELAHLGTYRNLFRLWPSSLDISVRMAWRQGRDQWTAEPWVSPPFEDNFWEVDLGQSKIRAAPLGTQTWQWRIEAKSTSAGDTLDVDYHAMLPSGEGYGKARKTVPSESLTTFSIRDEFNQSVTGGSDPLSGLALPVGGTWSGAGDTDDFVVEDTGHTAQRTAVSDTAPRFGIAGTTTFTNVVAQVDVKSSASSGSRLGLFARYTDTSNYVAAFYDNIGAVSSSVQVVKRVAGVDTSLSRTNVYIQTQLATFYSLRLIIDPGGKWYLWGFPQNTGTGSVLTSGYDSALATGGALASGKVGLYDVELSSTAATRNYDNFTAGVPALDAAIFSGQSLEFRSYGDDPALREDSSGTYWGRPPETRGGRLWLPPAGEEDRTTRVACLARRNDIETQASDNIADSTSVTCHFRPRWVNIPREA